MNKQFYLTTKKGLFFYSLWENSNFLGNNPKQWYLFARDRASVYRTKQDAIEDKNYLINRIKKQGNDYIENHLKKNNFPESEIIEHTKKIERVVKYFSSLQVTEKIQHIN